MYLCTLQSTTQILSVTIVERKETEGENAALNVKAVALYANTDVGDLSWCCLHMRHQFLHPAEISQHNCAPCKTVSFQPFPLKTQHNLIYPEAVQNYPTATSQVKKMAVSVRFLQVQTGTIPETPASVLHTHEVVPYSQY